MKQMRYDKPAIGSKITVVTGWDDLLKGAMPWVQRRYTKTGIVIPSNSWDEPDTFRLATGDPLFPAAVIPLDHVVEITGAVVTISEVKNDNRVWQIPSSNGKSSYSVTRINGLYSCTCVGFGFHGNCKHINQAKLLKE